jgi:hypothetical protein
MPGASPARRNRPPSTGVTRRPKRKPLSLIRDGRLNGFGALFPAPPDSVIAGGYWIMPFALAVGLAVLLGTHRVARAWLRRRRERDAVLTAP